MTNVEPMPKKGKEEPGYASLYEALCAAQATLPDVSKNRTAKVKGKSKAGVDFEYSYKYADITDVLAVVRPHFSKYGIAILQPTRIEDRLVMVATRLVHNTTGQFEESLYPVSSIGPDHRELGAALTYARRYALCSMIGLAPDEDTDGQTAAASGSANSARPPRETVTNPKTGRQVDPNSANQLRKSGAWDSFTDKVQGYIEARDGDGLKLWFNSDEVVERISKWAWRDEAQDHYERALEHIDDLERGAR